MATIELAEADDGTVVQARVGDAVRLRLPDNPTTGYQWELEPPTGGVVVGSEAEYEPASPLPGSSGTTSWMLRAAGAGQVVLHLKRWRRWEGDSSVLGRFTVTVDVGP